MIRKGAATSYPPFRPQLAFLDFTTAEDAAHLGSFSVGDNKSP